MTGCMLEAPAATAADVAEPAASAEAATSFLSAATVRAEDAAATGEAAAEFNAFATPPEDLPTAKVGDGERGVTYPTGSSHL